VTQPVVVTGAAGFAGSHLVDRLEETLPHDQPLFAWRRPGGRAARRGSDRVTWTEVDLLDAPSVASAIARTRPEVVYHCAGSPHVASSWSDTLTPLSSNVLATEHLLLAIEQHSPRTRLFVPSSALVYATSATPRSEDAPLVPKTPYGVSKLAQELLACRAQHDRGLDIFIARPFNHVGPRQDASFATAAFARQIALIETGQAPPVIHVGNLEARRDLTDVRDTVRAYQLITASGIAGRVYNVCSGVARRVGDLLEGLLSIARVNVEVAVDPERLRPSDVPVLVGDPSRIQRELGWQAEIPIERTLADLLAYWRQQVAGAGVTS
jgi:GDP-4-dehydro-6-deoxy-D-mannose reductase